VERGGSTLVARTAAERSVPVMRSSPSTTTAVPSAATLGVGCPAASVHRSAPAATRKRTVAGLVISDSPAARGGSLSVPRQVPGSRPPTSFSDFGAAGATAAGGAAPAGGRRGGSA
jgi:hypothetical protein